MGEQRSRTCLASLIAVAMALMMMMNTTEGQTSTDCASQLVPCAEYLNSSKPPATCCDPIKKTVETQLTCLCNLFYSPGLLQSFNISTDQALTLSRNCGVTTDLTTCKQSGSAPPPTAGSPPGGDHGAAGRVSFTGFPFLILLASMLFN